MRRHVRLVECPCGYGIGTPPYSCLRCRVVVTRGTVDEKVWGSHYVGFHAVPMATWKGRFNATGAPTRSQKGVPG